MPFAFSSASDADLWVKLPSGTTPLTELGAYRVVYQLDGGDPVEMPPGWSGDFTDDVGIAYYEHGRVAGRRAHVLHCPWRRGPGSVRLEYALDLPDEKPIALTFGIAMRPDVVEKSDGVTFIADLCEDVLCRRLMSEHYTKGEWKDFRFDLSEYAGRRIHLGFQVEPGPERNSGFDFSMLGEPTLTIGRATDTGQTLLRDIVRSRAYRETEARDLRTLASTPINGVVPSTNDPHLTLVEKTDGAWRFLYVGDDCRIEYRCPLTDGSLSALTAQVDSSLPIHPCQGGGVQFGTDQLSVYAEPERAELVGERLEGDHVAVTWRYHLGDRSATVTWCFRLVGKALAIEAVSEGRDIGRLSLGQPWTKSLRRRIRLPYLGTGQAYFLRPQHVYVMSYLDWSRSMATRTPATEAYYVPRLDGKRNPLRETGYVAVSPELGEVLPNIPWPASPYLVGLAPRTMLDIWGGTYGQGAELLRTLKSYGVDDAAAIWHNWQRYGYDVKLPDHLPANPALGGDEAMTRLAAAARDVGYVFSLHENYIDFYPDAPSYNAKDVAVDERGKPWKAWYHPGTKVQSWGFKATRTMPYAQGNTPEIARRFGTTAAYLDVHTCVTPWRYVDHDPKTELAAAALARVTLNRELFQFMRDQHGGPLFGEGWNHFYWAGLVDGVEAQVGGGEDRDVLVDFDLLKLHPQMVNHGMGYYSRWLRTGRETKWWVEAPTPAQLDKYRAQEIAYGHAGFVGEPCVRIPYFVWREHNIVAPVQALYGAARATEILYEVDGRLVASSAAVPAGQLDRVRVTYDSGLVVHVNLREAPWRVGRYLLPQFGFLAQAPGLLAYTALENGTIIDYAEDERTLFADARSYVYRPWEQGLRDVEPRLKGLKDNGDGTIDVTYEWAVNEELGRDYTAFVHFVEPGTRNGEGIRFQDDHPVTASRWRKGEVVTGAPRRVAVPRDDELATYDIVIGLYAPGEPRVALKGVQEGDRRILIGRIAVERDGGQVKSVKRLPIEDVSRAQRDLRKRFDERMNPKGRKVAFGTVRTDGSFKLYKKGNGATVVPYPRDRVFTIELDTRRLAPGAKGRVAAIDAYDADGKRLGGGRGVLTHGWLAFRTELPGAARYEIAFAEVEGR